MSNFQFPPLGRASIEFTSLALARCSRKTNVTWTNKTATFFQLFFDSFRPRISHLMTNKRTQQLLSSFFFPLRVSLDLSFFFSQFFFLSNVQEREWREAPERSFDLTVLDRVAFWMLSIIHAFNMLCVSSLLLLLLATLLLVIQSDFFFLFTFSPYIIFLIAAFFLRSIESASCVSNGQHAHMRWDKMWSIGQVCSDSSDIVTVYCVLCCIYFGRYNWYPHDRLAVPGWEAHSIPASTFVPLASYGIIVRLHVKP